MIDSVRVQVWGAFICALFYGWFLWLFADSTGGYATLGAWLKWFSLLGLVVFIMLAIAKSVWELFGQGRK